MKRFPHFAFLFLLSMQVFTLGQCLGQLFRNLRIDGKIGPGDCCQRKMSRTDSQRRLWRGFEKSTGKGLERSFGAFAALIGGLRKTHYFSAKFAHPSHVPKLQILV